MKKYIFSLGVILIAGVITPSLLSKQLSAEQMQNTSSPKYLYKILKTQNWKESQPSDSVILSEEDNEFIHLSTEDQLPRIINKYWSNVPEYVILKVETNQLPGRLVFEANEPGGNKYYHLYEGSIPLKSIQDVKVLK